MLIMTICKFIKKQIYKKIYKKTNRDAFAQLRTYLFNY